VRSRYSTIYGRKKMGKVTRKLLSKLRGRVSNSVISEQEKEVAKQTLRIAKNTLNLLSQGLYTGQAARALAETQEWVAGLVGEIESKMPREVDDAKKTDASPILQ
jgi:hypothetical protein